MSVSPMWSKGARKNAMFKIIITYWNGKTDWLQDLTLPKIVNIWVEAKNFFIRQFFQKMQYFLRKPWKTGRRIWKFFREKSVLRHKLT